MGHTNLPINLEKNLQEKVGVQESECLEPPTKANRNAGDKDLESLTSPQNNLHDKIINNKNLLHDTTNKLSQTSTSNTINDFGVKTFKSFNNVISPTAGESSKLKSTNKVKDTLNLYIPNAQPSSDKHLSKSYSSRANRTNTTTKPTQTNLKRTQSATTLKSRSNSGNRYGANARRSSNVSAVWDQSIVEEGETTPNAGNRKAVLESKVITVCNAKKKDTQSAKSKKPNSCSKACHLQKRKPTDNKLPRKSASFKESGGKNQSVGNGSKLVVISWSFLDHGNVQTGNRQPLDRNFRAKQKVSPLDTWICILSYIGVQHS